jgi:putative peptidoglycan lipid II flippase
MRLPRRDDVLVRRVLVLMLPVSVGLGLINIDVVLNSLIGSLVSDEVPSAIDKAFRIYMLPQGMFSVAVATVLFPQLSRLAARRDFDGLRAIAGIGMRQIALLLIPAAAATIVLATPMVRLVYQRGAFDAESTKLVSEALVVFGFSLPFSGWNLLLTRTFFSLQRPWITTAISVANMLVNVALSALLYKPFGIAGIVLGSVAGTLTMAVLQGAQLSRLLHGIEGRHNLAAIVKMLGASALLAGVSYGVWYALDQALGRSLIAQIVSLGIGISAGIAVYTGAILALRIREAHQIRGLIAGRFGRGRSGN